MLRIILHSLFAAWLVLAAGPEATEEETTLYRHFQSSHSDVYVISNFLPMKLALEWRRRMHEAWQDTLYLLECLSTIDDESTCPNKEMNAFHYATNNPGTFQGFTNNVKVRSLDKIPQRNQTAHEMYQRDAFSYAKWELPPSHELVQEMEVYFTLLSTRQRVQRVLAKDYPNVHLQAQLADLFVTYYGPGDFLSTHNDGVSGTWAFVLSLTQQPKTWTRDLGGTLQFACPPSIGYQPRRDDPDYWCEELVPTFNTAIFFNTRSPNGLLPGPDHQVLPVNVGPESGYLRFGLTGWYMDVNDIMPEHHKAELEKMRSRG
jgi:Rps23 Pro-64 3,4-dihydroxylase Tpa1-like proline 4-hydroxylase